MSLSQPKIDLAVLYKLYQHAEDNGEAITPEDVFRLFEVRVSLRRVELALGELHAKGDVEREYHPHYSDEGLWQISRNGMAKVDRALRVPTSFLARLHLGGDRWLESDDARDAVLKKLPDAPPLPKASIISQTAHIPQPNQVSTPVPSSPVDWGKWGAIAGVIAIPLAIALWYFS